MRIAFLDRMRALWVVMMVIDHGLQGYAQTFGHFWFFMDTDRHAWCDGAHVFFNALLMPPLFLIAGLWVIPHLTRDGVGLFLKKRFYRLGVPFIFGVIFLVPMMSFPEYHASINPYDSYIDFWKGPFIWSALQAGPFWFLGYLLILTTLSTALALKAPGVIRGLKHLATWSAHHPYHALAAGALFFAIMQGLSDLTWGAPYWISMRKIIHPWGAVVGVQGSRFLLQAFYFFMGVGLGQTSVLTDFRQKVQTGIVPWKRWVFIFVVVSAVYIAIAQPYDPDGGHGHRRTILQTLEECDLSAIFLRTSLQPMVCLLATLAGMMVFIRSESVGEAFWSRLTPYAYGIYFIHEIFTVAAHSLLSDTSWPLLAKVLIASFGVLIVSWASARWALPRLPLLGNIFSNG